MSVKKTIGFLHLWLGLLSGIVIIVLGITGCLYAFIDEIKPVVYKDKLFVLEQQATRLPLSTLKPIAQKALGEEYPFTRAEIPQEKNKSYIFYAYKSNREAWNYFDEVHYAYAVFINPYNGSVMGVQNLKYEFFRLVLNLHYDLFLGKTGKYIVGCSTIMFVILLFSGIVLWWPKNNAAAKQRFRFKWKDSTQWKRKNYDLHNILGFYNMLLALIIALTGLVWAFEWFNDSVQFIVNGKVKMERPQPLYSDTTQRESFSYFDQSLAYSEKHFPDAGAFFFSFPKEEKSVIQIFASGKGSERYKGTSFQFDQHTGALLKKESYQDKNNGQKLQSMNYDIHVGSIFSLPGKIVAFLVSFVTAGLPITGFYIWLGRKKKNKKGKAVSRSIKEQNKNAKQTKAKWYKAAL